MTDHFYMTLPSNSSMEYFPDNKITRFKTQLPKRISLQGDWEVGLVEIHFPCTFQTLTDDDFSLRCEYDDSFKSVYSVPPRSSDPETPLWKSFSFPGGVYYTIESLVQVMMDNPELREVASITVQDSNIDSLVTFTLKDGVRKVILSETLRALFNFSSATIKRETEIAKQSNILASYPEQMFVYCDIIDPQHVGDTVAPLLRIVNLDIAANVFKQVVTIFTHPHYVPLLKRDFQQLEIDLRDDLGQHLPFVRGQLNVKLHFRKIR